MKILLAPQSWAGKHLSFRRRYERVLTSNYFYVWATSITDKQKSRKPPKLNLLVFTSSELSVLNFMEIFPLIAMTIFKALVFELQSAVFNLPNAHVSYSLNEVNLISNNSLNGNIIAVKKIITKLVMPLMNML